MIIWIGFTLSLIAVLSLASMYRIGKHDGYAEGYAAGHTSAMNYCMEKLKRSRE